INVLVFFDTNVLIYSICRDPAEATKRELATALLERDDGAVSIQVLQEFYTQATRKTRPHRLPHEMAIGLIRAWTRFRVQDMTLGLLDAALEIRVPHPFSYCYSAIIASSHPLGSPPLYPPHPLHAPRIHAS